MMNAVLLLIVAGVAVFAGIVMYDPRFAKWLATVIYSRALAVEAGREMFAVARRSKIELRTTVEATHSTGNAAVMPLKLAK